MNYLISIGTGNVHQCGYKYTTPTQYKSMYHLTKLAQRKLLVYKDIECVYLINNYTQAMCEMDTEQFVQYVKRNGKLLASR